MRFVLILFFTLSSFVCFCQYTANEVFSKDSLLIIKKNPAKGFHHDYLLFIPAQTPLHKKLFLLVEPNNTGKLSDDMKIHMQAAIQLATVSSVGNNIATELHIPLLVPVFPRTATQPLMYTHALDRDIMIEQSLPLKRLDLQLIGMIEDAIDVLLSLDIKVDPRIFMNGFSASATFTNRFSLLHPGKIRALAMGGFNGKLMIPQAAINGISLNYPIGVNDFSVLFKKEFDKQSYKAIPQFIYMGKLDDNDAVQFDDAYSKAERKIINENIGRSVQERYLKCQAVYQQNDIHPLFRSYENIGHWTTGAMNLEVVKFFLKYLNEE